MANEFDNLSGLSPDKIPYKPKPIPKELKEVKKTNRKSVSLNFSDYWNIIKAIFRNEALAQIQGKSYLYETALNIRYILMCLVAVLVIILLIKLFV